MPQFRLALHDGLLRYEVVRSVPCPPRPARRDLLVTLIDLTAPFPADAEPLGEDIFWQLFCVTRALFGAHDDGHWVEVRTPRALSCTHLVRLTKDLFCPQLPYDIEFGAASLRTLRASAAPNWSRSRYTPTTGQYRPVIRRALARTVRRALEAAPDLAVVAWAQSLMRGTLVPLLLFIWRRHVRRLPVRLSDYFPAGPWATPRQFAWAVLLEAMVLDLLAAGADNGGELHEMGWQPYRPRWLASSRLLRRLLVWMAKLEPVLANTDD